MLHARLIAAALVAVSLAIPLAMTATPTVAGSKADAAETDQFVAISKLSKYAFQTCPSLKPYYPKSPKFPKPLRFPKPPKYTGPVKSVS